MADNFTRGMVAEAAAGIGAYATKTITFDGTELLGDNTSAAFATLTSNATAPANNNTVTIGSTVYTYKTTLTGAAFEVLIGASASTALDNIKSAIDASAGEGTTYGTGTTAHPTVSGSTKTATTLLVVADANGPAGNLIAVSETSANLDWGQTTLAGGSAGTAALFTVTGTVLMKLFAVCSVNLAGATATIAVGTALSAGALIAQTTATDIDVDEIWHDATPDASIELSSVATEKIVNQNVQHLIGTAPITAGALNYICICKPISLNGFVV